MKKENNNQGNTPKIKRETLSQLDDEQLKQIAGGAVSGNPDAPEEEESCTYVGSCEDCCNGPQ